MGKRGVRQMGEMGCLGGEIKDSAPKKHLYLLPGTRDQALALQRGQARLPPRRRQAREGVRRDRRRRGSPRESVHRLRLLHVRRRPLRRNGRVRRDDALAGVSPTHPIPPICRTPLFPICHLLFSFFNVFVFRPPPPISPICRTPLFPYLTF